VAIVEDTVFRIVRRDPVRTEADLQADIAMLLLIAGLNLDEHEVVKRESQVGDGTRRRIDVEVGHLVIEVKRDLRRGRVLPDAEVQLAGYLAQREADLGGRFAGVLTDGATWLLYRLVDGGRVERVAELRMSETAPDAERLAVWLESIMATRTQVRPTLMTIEELLGAQSPAHRFDHAVLAGMLEAAAHDPEVRLKRELWSKLLKTAYGDAFADDAKLFVNHTLLVITAEAIAHAIVGFNITTGLSVNDLVSGEQFSRRQIYGVVEQDFFDWPITLPGGQDLVSDIARRVARFDWSSVEHDVLKVLYESVIEQQDRESLGEYYTADWLAALMVADRVTDPAQQRVLDPSCGSGTFVFHAVKAHLAAVDATGMGAGQAALSAAEHVFGIDIHPVAVTLARVTYLMAIGTDRLNANDRGALRIPVFLGDSLQWERHQDLFTSEDALTISTSSEDLISGGGGSLFADDLVFPSQVWADGPLFDSLVNDMAAAVNKTVSQVSRAGKHSARLLAPILNRHRITNEADRQVLLDTFETWIGLQRSQRDRIWGYYVRNLARPVWLALPSNRVDVLVGNPPWLRYSKMTAAMQTRYKELARPRQLLVGGLGASARDLSTLFVTRSIELYLIDGGRFGFVMPFGTLSRRPHTGFRAANWNSDDSPALQVSFDEPWDLSSIRNLFPMTSCVVRGRLTENAVPMPATATPWNAPRRHSPASPGRPRPIAAIEAGSSGASAYETAFRQGAILVPRMLLFVDQVANGPLGAGAGRIQVTSARSRQEKQPWKSMTSLEGIVEAEFLLGAHLGETVLPYRTLPPRQVVLPADSTQILSEARIADHPALAEWWSAVEAVWAAGRVTTETAPLLQRMDYHGQLAAQLPVRPHRVAYTKSGNTLAAARLEDSDRSVIDHKLYWAGCTSIDEARYLVAVLNSATLLDQVTQFQAVGLFGARDFDKYVFRVGIPVYSPANPYHRELAAFAAQAEDAVATVTVPDATRFVEARRVVTAHLETTGIKALIEEAVMQVLPRS
jgi:SAM-dependent methyltransferase